MTSDKPKQAREIHFKTYLKPDPAIVYDMAKCTPDLWTIEQRWEFVEKSAYDQAIKDLDEARTLVARRERELDEYIAHVEKLRAEVEQYKKEILERARRDQGMIDRREDLLKLAEEALEEICREGAIGYAKESAHALIGRKIITANQALAKIRQAKG